MNHLFLKFVLLHVFRSWVGVQCESVICDASENCGKERADFTFTTRQLDLLVLQAICCFHPIVLFLLCGETVAFCCIVTTCR